MSSRGQSGPEVFANCLQCGECGRVSREDERGWTARLDCDGDLQIFCPQCDEAEFSGQASADEVFD